MPVRQWKLGFLGVPLVACALAACGGSGNSVGTTLPPPLPGPSVTLPPSPPPDPRPSANGDAFTYSGKLSQVFTRFASPAPSPTKGATPQPTGTPWVGSQSATVTQNVTIATGATFNNRSGLVDMKSSETDAGQHAVTTTSTSHAYVAYAPSAVRAGSSDVTLAGATTNDSSGVAYQTVYASGSGVFDQLPEVTGATWKNSASRTETENDPGGQTSSTTYNADGTYKASFTYPEGTTPTDIEGATASTVTYPDGSGVYQFPLIGAEGGNSTITINAPENGLIDGMLSIAYGPGENQTFQLKVWYPTTPPQAASDTFVDDGSAQVPASCNVAASYAGSSATKIVETRTRLDVIFGELETATQTTYTSGSSGVLCTVIHDDLKAYYDFSGQGSATFVFAEAPVQETIIDETLGLQKATLATASGTRRSTKGAPALSALPNASILSAHVEALSAYVRNAHARTTYNAFRSRIAK